MNSVRRGFQGVLFFLLLAVLPAAAAPLPNGFVYLDEVVPGLLFDLRYAGHNNFIGEPIDGYLKPRAILTRPAAQALGRAQEELKPFGLGLKVFDAYRPQRAVDHFVRWAKDIADVRMKPAYYPAVDKTRLFRDGYIAERSGHSRGSTVDLTVVALDGALAGELDMGGTYDFFDPHSWAAAATPGAAQRANRLLLQLLMKKHGFRPYEQEWWHFTLNGEPFPETYFDFPVQ